MTLGALVVIGVFIVVLALVGDQLERLPITPPMLAVAVGLMISAVGSPQVSITLGSEEVLLIAEVTLIVLLFSDASRISWASLRDTGSLPARLLLVGLPLTAGLGILAVGSISSGFTWAQAALVAAILTPTDAALGQAVVMSPRVPARIRHALEVESGLNDGLIVPVIGIMVALVVGSGIESNSGVLVGAMGDIGLGVLLGGLGGYVFGRIGRSSMQVDAARLRLATLAALAATVGLAIAVGGNGFIAAFVAGLALRSAAGELCDRWLSFSENVGQLGAIVAFVMFGATMVGPALDVLDWQMLLTAFVLLTVARMIPVAAALTGSGVRRPTVAFIGWFGPRGLASMLFALALSHEDLMVRDTTVIATVTITVLASVILHGMTAAPLARLYGNWLDGHPKRGDLREHFDVRPQRARPSIAADS